MINIEELEKQQKLLREKVLLANNTKTHEFANMIFYEGMSFISMDESQLIMSHAYLHRSYAAPNPVLNRDTIKRLHKKMVDEFKNRKKEHKCFDELDKIAT
jgi:hypothetical protein